MFSTIEISDIMHIDVLHLLKLSIEKKLKRFESKLKMLIMALYNKSSIHKLSLYLCRFP